ncbi:hypothetical protein TSAR_016172 [Trichomalopsis sarcophagae]|uniref:Odorant receptor n=1 Tax=Trichomalopsis sarcophagae TaxID=543379 RepID=A0A232EX22_9HYME|nr:hypothetical protein TSAR_016172 [Trichomalopsis sarcophagae]
MVWLTFVPPTIKHRNAKEYAHPFPYYTDYMIIEKYYYVHQIFIRSLFFAFFYVGIFWLSLSSTFISIVLRNIVELRKKLSVDDELKKEKTIEYDLINIINKHTETIQLTLHMGDVLSMVPYFLNWILLSTEARELLRMIIWRSSKADKLTAGKVITLSMGSFASVICVEYNMMEIIK